VPHSNAAPQLWQVFGKVRRERQMPTGLYFNHEVHEEHEDSSTRTDELFVTFVLVVSLILIQIRI
jgi:hypothetical protein